MEYGANIGLIIGLIIYMIIFIPYLSKSKKRSEEEHLLLKDLKEELIKHSARIKIVHFKQTNDMSRKPSARNERSEWRALGFGA